MIYQLTYNNFAERLVFPVNPAKLQISDGGTGFNEFDVVKGGETITTGNRRLYRVAFSSFFPRDYNAGYCEYPDIPSPWEAVAAINRWRESGLPLRLLITETNINIPVVIYEFKYEERGGEPGDVYFDISFKQYRFVTIREMAADNTAALQKASYNLSVQVSDRPDYSQNAMFSSGGSSAVRSAGSAGAAGGAGGSAGSGGRVHVVKAGDCLYNIALKYYGNGNKYTQIYSSNKGVIDPRNQQYSMPRYTIYPGQRLVIP